MNQLYKLTEQQLELKKMASDEDLSEELIADTFQALQGQFEEKAEAIIYVDKEFDSTIDVISEEIKRLQARKKVMANAKERLREYLRTNMEATEISKIECPLFTITLAKARDIAGIDDVEKLPDDLVEVEVVTKPKKAEILKRLKSGEDVPGAYLDKSKRSLTIK